MADAWLMTVGRGYKMAIMTIRVTNKDVMLPRGKLVTFGGRRKFIKLGRSVHKVYWGTTPEARERNHRSFTDWNKAVQFAQSLAKKYGNLGYQIDFQKVYD